ncbi:MAG TPA: UDP-glucose 4-epimerase GalE [Bacteroidia bacterium]|nr:UDP-glucose 4-epimerase GalE [Bacteroidia bacterium]
MKQKQIVLVTGGAGYIGSHTIIELLKNPDIEVISVDNFSNSNPDVYDRITSISGRNLMHYPIDLCNAEETKKLFAAHPGISGIIHFAAYKAVGESVENPLKYYGNNVGSLVNILRMASEYGIKHIIFSSSCSVYGNIEKLPVTESTPMGKTESPYAYTKVIGEKIIQDYVLSSPTTKAIILRYFNPVGAHVSGLIGELPINKPTNLVPVITQTAIGRLSSFSVFGTDYATRDGSCVRDYVHVSDIANAHVMALEHLHQTGQACDVFNLGTGQGVSVLEAIAAFKEVSGITPAYTRGARRPGDVEAIYSDCSKAESVLKWKAAYSLHDMMATAWKWEQNLAQTHGRG